MRLIEKLAKNELAIGLPKLNYSKDHIYDACQMDKQKRNSFFCKDTVPTNKLLQLIHMDLFGPTRTTNIRGKRYTFVTVDYYSYFTSVVILSNMDDTLKKNEIFYETI